jgi:hypothetical protein
METGKNYIAIANVYQCHGITLTVILHTYNSTIQIRSGKSVPWYEDIKKEMQWMFIGMLSAT